MNRKSLRGDFYCKSSKSATLFVNFWNGATLKTGPLSASDMRVGKVIGKNYSCSSRAQLKKNRNFSLQQIRGERQFSGSQPPQKPKHFSTNSANNALLAFFGCLHTFARENIHIASVLFLSSISLIREQGEELFLAERRSGARGELRPWFTRVALVSCCETACQNS